MRKRLLKIEEEAPRTGMRIPFETVDDRPVIAWKGLRLVLDSGAPALILYKKGAHKPDGADGLLPVTMFRSVYVNPWEGYVIVN